MDEKMLAKYSVEMAPRVIGEAVLDLLAAGQEVGLAALQARLQAEQARRGPGNLGRPTYEAALKMIEEAAQRNG